MVIAEISGYLISGLARHKAQKSSYSFKSLIDVHLHVDFIILFL